MPTLLLVDGSSYLYRAFHGLPDLRSPDGLPTGAIRGVLSMLRRLESDFKADYKAVIFDAKGKTFRDDWFPDYKANRPSMPEDLVLQVQPLHEAIIAEGWPLLMIDGVEADDVIGTLSVQATAAGLHTVISTGDKDLAQLVNPSVQLINTMTEELLDEAGVLAKFGVPPDRIVDYLTLIGDTVDNVPGVAKCGPKTALKWLTQYGSLDEVVAHAGEIGGVVGQNLRDHISFLPLGKKLITVRCDLELPLQPIELLAREADKPALLALYTRFGFRGWINELNSTSDNKAPSSAKSVAQAVELTTEEPKTLTADHRTGYDCILDWSAFEDWLKRIEAASLVAFDTETTSLDPFAARIVGVSLAVADGQDVNGNIRACYIPVAHDYPGAPDQLPRDEVLAKLKPWLESAAPKVGQNMKYDQHVLANHHIALGGVAHDTMLQSYVLESDKGHDMDQLAARHLGLKTIPYTELCGKGAKQIGFDQVALDQAAEYAAEDADITLRLHQTLFPQIEADAGLLAIYRDFEMPAREVLFRMERNGILIDSDKLNAQSHELGLKLMALEQEAYVLAGQPFNLSSPKQLAEILFIQLGLPVKKKTPGGAPSTDEEVLSELALDYPLPKLLLETRQMSKLKSTYTDKLPRMVNAVTGRVHTHFSQSTAVTGRLASSEPNLQNIPVRTEEGRRIRMAFIAAPGCQLLSADYSQVELRIMAHLSGDERLLQAFAQGEDVHRATAAEIFGITPIEVANDQRRVAKSINFGLIYGMSAFGLARQLGLERSAAQTYIDRYFARYPGVARYMEETRKQARQQGYVETVFGRRLWLPEIRATQAARRQGAERAAINAPMQGTAADLIKAAMVAVQNWLDAQGLNSRLLLQVHDELILEVPESELATVRAALPRLMAGVAKLKVPLVVDVGQGADWEAAH
ncbi:MAG: hypothetical protein RIR18_1795 [Pseudomonadota bacterium]